MDREEIIKLIKEELEVDIQHTSCYVMWGEEVIETTVTLSIAGDIFNTSSDTVRVD